MESEIIIILSVLSMILLGFSLYEKANCMRYEILWRRAEQSVSDLSIHNDNLSKQQKKCDICLKESTGSRLEA